MQLPRVGIPGPQRSNFPKPVLPHTDTTTVRAVVAKVAVGPHYSRTDRQTQTHTLLEMTEGKLHLHAAVVGGQ